MTNWPSDFLDLRETGLLQRLIDQDDALVIWDAEFMPEEEIGSFERLEDQTLDITPFAKTGNGDYWAYLTDSLPKPEIVLCYHDSYEAEGYARNLSEFVFKRTVEFSGNDGLTDSGQGWNLEAAREMISLICSSFGGVLSAEMIWELRRIANSTTVSTTNGWTTLIPEDESRLLISKYAPASRGEVTFEWRE